jgi:hypothetical protein
MAKKQPHVPETRELKPNREQRRHPERLANPADDPLGRDERPPQEPAPDVPDAGTSGHKKKTAENWNQ